MIITVTFEDRDDEEFVIADDIENPPTDIYLYTDRSSLIEHIDLRSKI